MPPYGGTPICPKCSKAVYAAEQTMGPGRKLYHKPCLACVACGKRLDSYTLLEHDQQPYCKSCHVKNFGTRDLRQANLPHRPDPDDEAPTPISPPPTPNRFPPNRIPSSPPAPAQRAPSPVRTNRTGTRAGRPSPSPILRPNRALSPTATTFLNRRNTIPTPESEEDALEAEEQADDFDVSAETPAAPAFAGTATHVGRATTGFPRTVPLSPSKTGSSTASGPPESPTPRSPPRAAATVGRAGSTAASRAFDQAMATPLTQTATGTRYGAALGGSTPTVSPGRQWGGGTPQCPKCGKSVYFAEQVKATGKTWHKACLRCVECGTTLDSKKLTEREGEPFCHRCYGKLHGPQGGGYALLGKAGG
ncbi:LIM-domain-containing protein [Athelia psychrophila]|uniref:LIM-domain-containing protein n=1 Tax=Athelia psychrophila TaxID=1759441 RepID=A0A166T2I6_9AGAM|nr:LIM-domain-containing protein [Fibularhizoctonia sp. CBS 109695]